MTARREYVGALGPLFGTTVGTVLSRTRRCTSPAATAAVTIAGYRIASAAAFRDAPISLLTERADAADRPMAVPHAARTRYVGTDYAASLAETIRGTYTRDAVDTGVVASFDELAGPDLDPITIDPLDRRGDRRLGPRRHTPRLRPPAEGGAQLTLNRRRPVVTG